MRVKILGALDYDKVSKLLSSQNINEEQKKEILDGIKKIEKVRHSEIVSAAARLSRYEGNVEDVIKMSESKSEKDNAKFANRVISMGHASIIDHDYFVFSLKDVSVALEQTLIDERFSSFTIKSRREVDFSNSGYYIPNFHYENGILHNDNKLLKRDFEEHIKQLFSSYSYLIENGIKKEDARFVLPYNFNSNIIMGMDAHTILDLIIKFTKTKYSNIEEFKKFGDSLYFIAKEYMPYLIPIIDLIPVFTEDAVDKYLSEKLPKEEYEILDKVKLTNASKNIDEQILISAIMRRYCYDYEKSSCLYKKLCKEYPNFKYEMMKKITLEGDKKELTSVNFDFQIPVSYAVLTHLTRHRTHKMLIPDFFPNIDLTKYKVPPKIASNEKILTYYKNVFDENKKHYETLKSLGVRDEDLIYYTLSGNMINVATNMDAWTIRHILSLRECNKTQWETRAIANQIHNIIKDLPDADAFESILGPSCETIGICNEKKEHCGKKLNLKKQEIKVL